MAQITFYLPDELAEQARTAARERRQSLSAYMAELASRDLRPSGWPAGFSALFGAWEGDREEAEAAVDEVHLL